MVPITLLPAIVVALLVTISFMLALRPVALSIGLVDKPGGRKLHTGNIPIIGGLAMFVGLSIGILLLGLELNLFLYVLAASFLLVVVGVIDDCVALPPAARMSTQVAVVLIMVYGAHLQLVDMGDPFGTGVITTGNFMLVFTMLVTITMINAYNLIDGVDGLAGSLAIVALLAIAAAAGIGNPFGAAAMTVAASVFAFLMFNFPLKWNQSVRSFMGDSGSTLLGFSIVWICIGVSQGEARAISPVHCLWFAAIPIFDCLTCFVQRIVRHKSPFTPGRDHYHHALARGGYGVRQTLGILTGLQLLYAIIGLTGHFAGLPEYVMFTAWSVLGLSQRSLIRKLAISHRLHCWKKVRREQLAG